MNREIKSGSLAPKLTSNLIILPDSKDPKQSDIAREDLLLLNAPVMAELANVLFSTRINQLFIAKMNSVKSSTTKKCA